MRYILIFLLTFVLVLPVNLNAAATQKNTDTKKKLDSGNEVPGLKLPASQTVEYDEGFTTLKAECAGPVKWLVLSTAPKVKFKISATTPKEIDIGIPPYKCVITVFAVGYVSNKFTGFARTDLTINGPPQPAPPDPNPDPTPDPKPDVKTPLHLTIIDDPAARTPATAKVINSQDMRNALKAKKILIRVYSKNDPEIKTKKFETVLQKYGTPMVILQDNTGKGLIIGKLPATSDEVLKLVGPYVGGFK